MVVEVVGGGGDGGVRMVVQIVSVDGRGIWFLWLWVEAVMVADGGGSGVWWWLVVVMYGGGGGGRWRRLCCMVVVVVGCDCCI